MKRGYYRKRYKAHWPQSKWAFLLSISSYTPKEYKEPNQGVPASAKGRHPEFALNGFQDATLSVIQPDQRPTLTAIGVYR